MGLCVLCGEQKTSTMNNKEELDRLVEAVRQSGADIAPTYAEYIQLAFALATDCGEAGRSAFHQLCSGSSKYQREHADQLYTNALKQHKGDVHLGTVFYLAEQCGAKLTGSRNDEMMNSADGLVHTRARVKNIPESEDEEESITLETPDPALPLPVFPQDYDWPPLIQRILTYGKRPQQRDSLLLASLAVIGSTLNNQVSFLYGRRQIWPTLLTFVVAPSASGKGMLSWLRLLADPFHQSIRKTVDTQMKQYWQEKMAFDSLGKERKNHEQPVMPPNRMFLIPGNNSGTGILENIIDSEGVGLIFECEADTVSASINTDYGNFSDTLRKLFDHELLSFNRRQNHEYRCVAKTCVSVFLSGTPSQVKALIPSSENGLMSRFCFYYMNSVKQWMSQFDVSEEDAEKEFRQMGDEWKRVVDGLKEQGHFTVCFTAEQQQRYDETFSYLFSRSQVANAEEMKSSVARLGINILRMISIVAMLRALEDRSLMAPAPDIHPENLKDRIISRWNIRVTDADFDVFLSMAETLYLHATHILSFMDSVQMVNNGSSDRDMLLASLPPEFSRKEYLEKARQKGIPSGTANTWIQKLVSRGGVIKVKHGVYRKGF